MHSNAPALSLIVYVCGLSLAACGDSGSGAAAPGGANAGGGGAGGNGSGGEIASGGAQVGGGGASAGGSGGTSSGGGGAGGGSAGGGTVSGDALVGEWQPTGFSDSGNPIEPAPPDAPYFIFEADGDFLMGCGTAPAGTWVWDDAAPDPAIGVIHVTLGGSTMIDWFVTELDSGVFTFGEGGDFFYFARSKCP